MIQTLQGVKITPQGNTNRFKSQNWPNSFGFGGWIYSASVNIGFSNKPIEVSMSFVLETSSFSQSAAFFDINDSDLHCDAGGGGLNNETWYDIDLEGYALKNFLLFSYNVSIEAGQKILNVVFKDYSIILDKIYVGLFKKQGFLHPHVASCQLELPIRCQDCEYTGAAVTGTGIAYRDIGYGSYAGINGATYDNFAGSYYGNGNVYDNWSGLIVGQAIKGGQFDLNGGYLILGTESATEERCDTAPNITYSFIELLSSLRNNGLNFSGVFPTGTTDSDFVYRANHIGSLREVFQNWFSDLGYDSYCSGRSFIGVNLKTAINISDITQMADPTSRAGQYFQINNSVGGNSAILSFKSNSTLENTFKQAVVVENNYPITQKDVSKSVKRYVGITPMHPIALNQINTGLVSDTNLYGTPFVRSGYETSAFDDANVNFYPYVMNFGRLDGRSYHDVDSAIALSNYNDTLRDIFVAQRALRNVFVLSTNSIVPSFDGYSNGTALPPLHSAYCVANFNALGMFPILEISDAQMKADIITDYFSNGEKDGVANLNMDSQYFKVFIGYYNQNIKDEIVTWEKTAAGSMYKYGVVTKAPLTSYPFAPVNLLNDISPTSGFYGQGGLVYERFQNSFSPATDRYNSPKYTPFIDTLLLSGFVKPASGSSGQFYQNNTQYPAFIPPGYSDYPGRVPTGLWISTLDNEWGTLQQDFDRNLSFAFSDPCASEYSLDSSVQQILTDSDKHLQDWKFEYFRPVASPNLEKISDIIQSDIYNFDAITDSVVTTYTDDHWIKKKECRKLHVLIIPDTTNHPNLNIVFTANKRNKINPQVLANHKQKLYEADLNKNTTETPSICSISLLDEMCRNVLSGGSSYKYAFNPALTNQQTGCVILEDKNNYFLEGFPSGILYSPNSRSLSITIKKNPGGSGIGPIFDENGDYYYADLDDGLLNITTYTSTLDIIYPIQSFPNTIANYSGIMTSNVTTEFRIPAFNQIFGTPVNIANNNTSSFRIINNTVDNTLDPQLNPLTNQVKSYITVISGGGTANILATPEQYYSLVSSLNNYNLDTPMKTVDVTLAGPPSQFGSGFLAYLSPSSGLNQISLSVSDAGVKTNLTFSDRPKILPRQEAILNKIGPRIKGSYN